MMVSSYDADRVLQFCREHGRVRENDDRVMRLNGQKLGEAFRNSIASWIASDERRAPLGRWDELLMSVDMMLWQYEAWEADKYGDLSYTEYGSTNQQGDILT